MLSGSLRLLDATVDVGDWGARGSDMRHLGPKCLMSPTRYFLAKYLMFIGTESLTPRITGSKKQSDEGATLFAVRVDGVVMPSV